MKNKVIQIVDYAISQLKPVLPLLDRCEWEEWTVIKSEQKTKGVYEKYNTGVDIVDVVSNNGVISQITAYLYPPTFKHGGFHLYIKYEGGHVLVQKCVVMFF